MNWERRRDLEGGKEIGIWLLVDDDGSVERELYVESHEYRGGNFDVYTATPDDEWNHEGEFETSEEAFGRALELLSESPHPVEGDRSQD
ncbi:hypothetical protein [Halorussus lipolyticus]|uniref:hypothetical protein n=1 Tax=Halorussus lipolyticus TaxID=3034024 RepID=UPI0023E83446|nr:hypothetical protein [Halorussus sp. DT80]